jgi:cytochrome P450
MKKGDSLVVPIFLINRDPELWGPDADEWKPTRWEGAGTLPAGIPGVWGNTMSFLGGSRACIGFKFSLYEWVFFLLVLHAEFSDRIPGRRSSSTR